MTKFKVGDKVDRVAALRSFKMLEGEGPYTVTAVSPSAHFIQINLNTHYGDHYPWDARHFKLVEQDDPLPPAPESVRYYNSFIMGNNDQNLTVGPATEYPGEGLLHLLITPNSHSTRNVAPLSINMDADAALQLAHDLNRMANEIKRKEKQNA